MFKFIFPTFNFNIERWKWNKEYRVYVSNMGHFRDEYKALIPVKINQNGYCVVKTYLSNYVSAHRLVMITWCPTRDMENLTVDHLDHNKRNNAVTNLEWVSREENQQRAKEDYINVGPVIKNIKTKTVYYAKNKYKQYVKSFSSKDEIIAWLKTESPMASTIKGNLWSDGYILNQINTKLKTGGKFLYWWQEVEIPVV